MKELNESREDYLETIYLLQKQKAVVRSIDVADHMNVSKPSVCRAVSILKKSGFLTMDSENYLSLTDAGRSVAEHIYARHCFFREKLLNAGVDPETAEKEPCKMEHVISENTFRLLMKAYGGSRGSEESSP